MIFDAIYVGKHVPISFEVPRFAADFSVHLLFNLSRLNFGFFPFAYQLFIFRNVVELSGFIDEDVA